MKDRREAATACQQSFLMVTPGPRHFWSGFAGRWFLSTGRCPPEWQTDSAHEQLRCPLCAPHPDAYGKSSPGPREPGMLSEIICHLQFPYQVSVTKCIDRVSTTRMHTPGPKKTLQAIVAIKHTCRKAHTHTMPAFQVNISQQYIHQVTELIVSQARCNAGAEGHIQLGKPPHRSACNCYLKRTYSGHMCHSLANCPTDDLMPLQSIDLLSGSRMGAGEYFNTELGPGSRMMHLVNTIEGMRSDVITAERRREEAEFKMRAAEQRRVEAEVRLVQRVFLADARINALQQQLADVERRLAEALACNQAQPERPPTDEAGLPQVGNPGRLALMFIRSAYAPQESACNSVTLLAAWGPRQMRQLIPEL